MSIKEENSEEKKQNKAKSEEEKEGKNEMENKQEEASHANPYGYNSQGYLPKSPLGPSPR